MNEDLAERFGRSRRGLRPLTGQAQVWLIPQQLNTKVREYFENAKKPVDGGAWLSCPEIPTSAEVLDIETGGSQTSSEVELKCNRRRGAHNSKGKKYSRPKGPWASEGQLWPMLAFTS
jgi:helicase required for RNAi-mediated heterochromatin assembly 1